MNAAQNTITKIAHKTENFVVELTEGKTQAAVLTEIKDAGYNLGTKSLAAMMKGEKTEAGDFMVVAGEAVTESKENPVDAPKPLTKAEERALNKAKQKEEQEARAAAAKAANGTNEEKKPEGDTTEAKPANDTADEQKPADGESTPPAAAAAPKTPKKPLPEAGTYVQIRPGTSLDTCLRMLCEPKGVTAEELMKAVNWPISTVTRKTKKRGFLLVSETREGVGYYHIQFHADDKDRSGQRVDAKDLNYLVAKEKPAKAPKEKKATADGQPVEGNTVPGKRIVSPAKQAQIDAFNKAVADSKAAETTPATA